jgi:transcriptional/translational regulatory protein YebC/TACO1
MGAQGSVMYQFEKNGVITVAKNGQSLDDIFIVAADAGVDDIEDADEEVLLYTKPEEVSKVQESLREQGLKVNSAEISLRPIVTSPISDKAEAERALSFLEKLETNDDVQKVYANFDIPDELIEETN